MNKKQLLSLGIPIEAIDAAITSVISAAKAGRFRGKVCKKTIKEIVENPLLFVEDQQFSNFAKELIISQSNDQRVKNNDVSFRVWGEDGIEESAKKQMVEACKIPVVKLAALMGDAHLGYSVPIGGVLATKDAIMPLAIGVDISCSVSLSILDIPPKRLATYSKLYENALESGTVFGIGGAYKDKCQHPVMDQDWKITDITHKLKDKAWAQLGTSGSGNHFVEFGVLEIHEPIELGDRIIAAGTYVALMSHSGSRGAGANICKYYSDIAKGKITAKYRKNPEFAELAWLMMDSEAGQEYYKAMNLMRDYALANHECIHYNVTKLAGCEVLANVRNSHNLAWYEEHDGEKLIVHRKGATPADKGMLGIIPGSMADPAYLVVGKGDRESLKSASHGAGRQMSRTQAHKSMDWRFWKNELKKRGVKLLSAGLDEVPGAYKDIRKVMQQQNDLVAIRGEFMPRIVKMAAGGRAED